ncbi:MAG TPA: patatin-like phospholipase family protein [Alphaproteobacteria bacterium]|nr:patatin-like phospholipase family protein [Alphaproteobacteria bacterium]
MKPKTPHFTIAHFPGGGARAFATALKLAFFEEHTGLRTFQLFPEVITGSAGFLIATALYLPHPDDKSIPMMSARQLCERFPEIASALPRKPGYIKNNNDRAPLEDALKPYIGSATLKDLMGSIHTSSHQIDAGVNSCKHYAKFINMRTGQTEYLEDPETPVMDIALATTALPPVLKPHNGQIDLAFVDSIAFAVLRFLRNHPNEHQGLYVHVGNFRLLQDPKNHHLLENYGHIAQSLTAALAKAIGNHTYSQNIQFARESFGLDFVFDLEQALEPNQQNSPRTEAIITSSVQFQRIHDSTKAYIRKNSETFTRLGDLLGEIALNQMASTPDTRFSTLRNIQERDLPSPSLSNSNKPQRPEYLSEIFTRQITTAALEILSAWQKVARNLLLPPTENSKTLQPIELKKQPHPTTQRLG